MLLKATDARPYSAHRHGDRHQSLCLGLSAKTGDLTARTRELEDLFVLLTLRLSDSWKLGSFTFSSIQPNKINAAARHRDEPSLCERERKGNIEEDLLQALLFEGDRNTDELDSVKKSGCPG